MRTACPQLRQAGIISAPAIGRLEGQRGSAPAQPPRQSGVVIQSGAGSNAPATAPTARTQTRIFAASEKEAQVRPGTVTGTLAIFGQPAYVLIDPGSDRSYIRTAFSSHSDRPLEPLEIELVIHTLLGEHLVHNSCF